MKKIILFLIPLSFLCSMGFAQVEEEENFLVFGKESNGLPEEITSKYKNSAYQIPMFSAKIRSLNLANAVGIVIYEGLRKLNVIPIVTSIRKSRY